MIHARYALPLNQIFYNEVYYFVRIMCKNIIFDEPMPKKIFLSLYHKLFFIVSQSPNTVLLVQSYRLRRLRKAWLNKPECSAGLPSIGKCVIGVCYSEGWTFLPSFWKSSPLLLEGGNEWAMRCTPRSAMTSLDSLRTASHHLISDAKASYSVVVCAAACKRSLWMYALVF